MNAAKEKAKISWTGLSEYTVAINYHDGKGIALDPIFPKFIYNWFGRLNYSIFELKPSFDGTTRRKTMYTVKSTGTGANLSASVLMTNLLVEEINARAECSSSIVTIEEIDERRKSDPDFIDSLETQLINDIIMDFHPTSVQNRHFMTHLVARYFQVKPAEEAWLSGDLVNKLTAVEGRITVNNSESKSEPFTFDSDKLFFIEYQASEKQFNEGSGRTIIEAVDATKFNRLSRARRVVRFIRP